MGDGLSESEFERIEDNLDATDYKARRATSGGSRMPSTFAAWKNSRASNTRVIVAGAVIIAAVCAVLLVVGGGGAQRPSCVANSKGCQLTSDGIWVPYWYYGGLARAQGTPTGQAPVSTGAQPSTDELEEDGASPSQANSASSYSSSISSDGSDADQSGDSSDDSSDDGGSDDGGGGDDGS